MFRKCVAPVGLIATLGLSLSACAVTPYTGPNNVIARGADGGPIDSKPLRNREAAIAYDPDGCQNWIMDDGFEGYSSPRYDPVSGLPICNNRFPPGTVIGNYQTSSAAVRDWVPR